VGVVVAFGVMFTALAASAFVVRVRMGARSECAARLAEARRTAAAAAQAAAAEAGARELIVPGLPAVVGSVSIVEAGHTQAGASTSAVPIELISEREARLRAEAALGEGERAAVEAFRVHVRAGRSEDALATWNALPQASAARYILSNERHALADDWLATQLTRLERELGRRDCGAVEERLARLHRLLPERPLPDRMGDCR
jgi:hypothetical protein